ncbi:MAG: hypothetical protein GQ471_04540 [Nitrosopumilus sp.]|jgi:Na+-transporting NADH:ubiquinone oxidoreductase subunit NqrC|nr:hypothetical protein [Nitrosopumilus sp.]
MDYQSLQEKAMKISPSIRYATITDLNGKVKSSDHRKGVKNLLTAQESLKSLKTSANIWKARNQLSRKIGKGKYALAEYGKIKRIVIPLEKGHLLYLTTSTRADHSAILRKATRLKLK